MTAPSTRRWVAEEPASVGELLTAIGLDLPEQTRAIEDGRVFVDRHRVERATSSVERGQAVIVHASRTSATLPEPFILFDRDGVLAVDKPVGIPTIPDLHGAEGSLIMRAAHATRRSRDALHPTSRLDHEVSGVVTFATNDHAAKQLADARARGAYARRYVAMAAGPVADDTARWVWSIARDRDPRRRLAVDASHADAKVAATRVRVIARATVGRLSTCLLAIAPETGRTHQIRVHAAAAKAPLIGDATYGGPRRLTDAQGRVVQIDRVALHCARVAMAIDATAPLVLSSPIPDDLRSIASRMGWSDDALAEAIECDV